MYKDLASDKTKTHFKEVLYETQQIVEKELEYSSDADQEDKIIWESILAQIYDIRLNIVENANMIDWEAIYERYSIGQIGLQCFDEGEEMQLRLCDIFYGAVHYCEFPD